MPITARQFGSTSPVNVTGSRALGTLYTNNTSGSLIVYVGCTGNTSTISNVSVVIDGKTLPSNGNFNAGGGVTAGFTFIVPKGLTYQVNGSVTLASWYEQN